MNNGNGLLAFLVGITVLTLGISWGLMIVVGMMHSYGVLLGTISFKEMLLVFCALLGIVLPTQLLGRSILASA